MFDLMPFGHDDNSLFHYLDDMEERFFGNVQEGLSQFRTDIVEKDGNYILQAELPGFNKEDIHIDLQHNRLTIQASHEESKEEKKGHYVRKERKVGAFSRSFDVSGIDTSHIEAQYEKGVLELKLPKMVMSKEEVKKIDIQ